MNRLKLLKFGVALKITKTTRLPTFIGNTIRGAFGKALPEDGEARGMVFKTSPTESAPNPFVLSAPYPSRSTYSAGDTLAFSLTLIGSARNYEGEVRAALGSMCNGRLESAEVAAVSTIYDREWSDGGAETIPRCGKLSVNFITPTEILSNKTAVAELSFGAFAASLFGRISALCDSYGDSEFAIPYSLIARQPEIRAEYSLKQVDFKTSGQPVSGFVGRIDYLGDVTRYLPYIDLGGEIHIGKKTTRACGEYVFQI